jgi:ABC-type sugar transport system ATPase subunit
MASIGLDGVRKAHGHGRPALDRLTLQIDDGELMVLVGPSGSGKSTVLRLVAGLDEPTSGRIFLDGHEVSRMPPQQRDLAMVFQSYALYPHLTVRDNLAFPLRMRRVSSSVLTSKVIEVAAALGIDSLLDRKPAQLSGGERQRVALGRAMVREPRAFLLDEPLSNLDPALRAQTRAELSMLHRRVRATMLYVTHDQEEAMTLGGRIAVLRDGVLEQVGAPLEVYRRPANTFVATFIGAPAMNLLSPAIAASMGLGSFVAGVRPEDIAVVSPSEGVARGAVALVEQLGPTAVAHVQIAPPPMPPLRVLTAADGGLQTGDVVGIRVRRERLHRFDPATGLRQS